MPELEQQSDNTWLIACLCAAWCDTCNTYRHAFDELKQKHANKHFAWIDIEDQSDLIDDIEIENFPTILIEHQGRVLFLGTNLPDIHILDRLITSFEGQLRDGTTPKAIVQQALPENWCLSPHFLHR